MTLIYVNTPSKNIRKIGVMLMKKQTQTRVKVAYRKLSRFQQPFETISRANPRYRML